MPSSFFTFPLSLVPLFPRLWAPRGHNPGRATNLRKHGQRSRSTVASLARHGDFTGARAFTKGRNGPRRRRSSARAAGRNQTHGELKTKVGREAEELRRP